MPSAAFAFGGNSLCLRAMGSEIRSRRLLYDLCLVNRTFNVEFSPFLYCDVSAKTKPELAVLLESPHLHHVVAFTGLETLEPPTNEDDVVQQLLAKLPGLEKFTWRVPLTQVIIDALRMSAKKLKSICIAYPGDLEQVRMGLISEADDAQGSGPAEIEQEARDLYLRQDFSAFSNLEELTVINIYGDLASWRRQLVRILKNSPKLHHLYLGLSCNVVERHSHDGRHQLYTDIFDQLCDDFALSGSPPLKLRYLGCGSCFLPSSIKYVEKLTDLECLEELYVYNTNVSTHTDWLVVYDDDGTSTIPFDGFLSPSCPRLRRFSAHQLYKDVFDALASERASSIVPQLGVFFACQDMDDEETALLLMADHEHPALPLKLRMMELEIDRAERGEPSAEKILEALVATNADTLQGLAVILEGSPGNFEDIDVLQSALRQLPLLTQLVIVSRGGEATSDEGEIVRAAETMANAVPQLLYIGIYNRYWAIRRVSSGEGMASLERLEEAREREHVEIFTHSMRYS